MKYFYNNEAEQFSYVSIPKALFSEAIFAKLSVDSKILYGLLLEKMGESTKNNWLDDDGAVYIIYPIEEIQDVLGVSRRKAIDTMTELDNIGLIDRVRRGRGNPNIIYVKNFARPIKQEVQNLHFLSS